MEPIDLVAPPLITAGVELGKRLGLAPERIKPVVLVLALVVALGSAMFGAEVDPATAAARIGTYATAAIGVYELVLKPAVSRFRARA